MSHRLSATNQIPQKPAVCTLQNQAGDRQVEEKANCHEYAVSNMEQINAVTGRNSRWLSADVSEQSQFMSTQTRY